MNQGIHNHDRGLSHDLPKIIERGLGRRGVLGLFAGLGAVGLVGCGPDGTDETVDITNPATSAPPGQGRGAPAASGGATADGEIPEETAGPFPADGSNGVNVLSQSGVVRKDITSSFGSASGVAAGVPLTIKLKVVDLNGTDVKAMAGAAVYLWHCDQDGNYSMYSSDAVEENYLRGVQETTADGTLEFTSIFPAAYDGRWPHIHFEVYPSIDDATKAANKLRTTQLALPEAACREVYEADGYDSSLQNLDRTSLETDNVFSDGYSLQLALVTGSVQEGYVASLTVPV